MRTTIKCPKCDSMTFHGVREVRQECTITVSAGPKPDASVTDAGAVGATRRNPWDFMFLNSPPITCAGCGEVAEVETWCDTLADVGDMAFADVRDVSEEQMLLTLQNRLYREVRNGAGITLLRDASQHVCGVSLVGGCEGSDAKLPSHELAFPFTRTQWRDAIEACENESDTEWMATHGCEGCAELHGCDYDPGNTPVHEDCKKCQGEGIVV